MAADRKRSFEMPVYDNFELSDFEEISVISQKENNITNKVSYVKNKNDQKIYIAKQMDLCGEDVMSCILACQEEQDEKRIPGIPQIVCLKKEGDTLLLVEEFINSPTLAECIELYDISDREFAHILSMVCRIISPLHHAKTPIIHRDIKPDNILLDWKTFKESGGSKGVYVIDFNAAKIYHRDKSRDTRLMGTPNYAAPEQFGFAASDMRTDVYGVGAILKKFVADREINDGLEEIAAKATKLSPDDRYQSMDELETALLCYVTDEKKRGIPGFRTKNPAHMICAILGYAFCIYVAWLTCVKDGSLAENIAIKICTFIILISYIFLATDYRNIWSHRKYIRGEKRWIKIIAAIVYCVCIPVFWISLFALVVTILGI